MPTTFHPSNSRGKATMQWLNTRYSFSFANYYNPDRMGFGTLLVINEDVIAPDSGFDTHQHDNMEIITIPLSGSIHHKDTMGNEGDVGRNEIQTMSAGTGVFHSEHNISQTESTHLLQIWVLTKQYNITPFYDQKRFDPQNRHNTLECIVSPGDVAGSATIHQDAYFFWGEFDANKHGSYTLKNKQSGVYVFVISGTITIDNQELQSTDALAITDATDIAFSVQSNAFLLIMEIPMT